MNATHKTTHGSAPHTQQRANSVTEAVDDNPAISGVPMPEAEERGWKEEGIDENAQLGVQKAQATTLTWSRTALYTTLGWYEDDMSTLGF